MGKARPIAVLTEWYTKIIEKTRNELRDYVAKLVQRFLQTTPGLKRTHRWIDEWGNRSITSQIEQAKNEHEEFDRNRGGRRKQLHVVYLIDEKVLEGTRL